MSNFNKLNNHLKPREKLSLYGSNSLTDVELLAIILQSGSKKESVMILSQKLIEKYNGLSNVLKTSINELKSNKGIGEAKALKIKALNQININLQIKSVPNLITINEPRDIYKVTKNIATEEKENLILLCLDNKGKIIYKEVVFIGTINEITIHPREIFNPAIKVMAKSIAVVHNHPSGDSTPSVADIETTKRLIEIGKIVGINLIDHIIIVKNGYYSIRENENLSF